MYTNQFTSSFSGIGLLGYTTPWGGVVGGFIRVDAPAVLAAVLLTFDWTDQNGAQTKQFPIGLTVGGLSVPFSFNIFCVANSVLVVSGVIVGTPTITLNAGVALFN